MTNQTKTLHVLVHGVHLWGTPTSADAAHQQQYPLATGQALLMGAGVLALRIQGCTGESIPADTVIWIRRDDIGAAWEE